MKQHNITPYDEMMAFLINATCPILSDDHEWLCALHDTHEDFKTIFYDDVKYLIELAIRYGFFDSVLVPEISIIRAGSEVTQEQIKTMEKIVLSILEEDNQ